MLHDALTESGPLTSLGLVVITGGLALNIAYLLVAGRGVGKPDRLMRLISLWLDAKEAELRRRASRNSNSARRGDQSRRLHESEKLAEELPCLQTLLTCDGAAS